MAECAYNEIISFLDCNAVSIRQWTAENLMTWQQLCIAH